MFLNIYNNKNVGKKSLLIKFTHNTKIEVVINYETGCYLVSWTKTEIYLFQCGQL